MIDTATNAQEIHYEETNWKARPEFSPDGKRIVYASYLGRQWHQLWLMPSNGGDVFPLTYGEYDNINPRWSPDGAKVAYLSNHGGMDLSLVIRSRDENEEKQLKIGTHATPSHYMVSFQVDPYYFSGKYHLWAPSRISARAEDGRYLTNFRYRTAADDSFERSKASEEIKYFHSLRGSGYGLGGNQFMGPEIGETTLSSPLGEVRLLVTRGLDYEPYKKTISLSQEHCAPAIDCNPKRNVVTFDFQMLGFSNDSSVWQSGDLHVHRNYAGTYITWPSSLVQMAEAEDVNVIFDLLVNKEQRIPEEESSPLLGQIDPASDPGIGTTLTYGQEFHTSYWGHLGLLNTKHLIIPGYAGYPNTAAASLVFMDADVADMAHAQNKDALVGWVHPFDELPDPYKDAKLTNELPIDVALGKVDYYEVLGFSDHKSSAAIWYRLLNLGFHLPAGAGTDAMTNFASLRGPVGLNRVYVNVQPGPLKLDEWLRNLKAGKTFATNGPLLRFSLGGQPIGGEVKLAKPGEVQFTAALRSIVPVDKVEVVCNGGVVKTIFAPDQRSGATQAKSNARSFAPKKGPQDDNREKSGQMDDSQGHAATTSLDVSGMVPISKSGWCVLRAYSDHAEEPIMDIYPYGTTSPIYVTVAGEKPRSPEDAKFFSKWIERVREDASVHPDYNTPAEREHVLKVLDEAAAVYGRMQEAGGGK